MVMGWSHKKVFPHKDNSKNPFINTIKQIKIGKSRDQIPNFGPTVVEYPSFKF